MMDIEDEEDFFETKRRQERKQKLHSKQEHKELKNKKNSDKLKQEIQNEKAQREVELEQMKQQEQIAEKQSQPGQKDKQNKKKLKDIGKPQDLVKKTIGRPNFIIHDVAPADIPKSEQEAVENKVRRWDIFVSEIKLENLQKDDLSVFLNFRLGQVGKNKSLFPDVSSGEIFFKSEVAKDVKRSEIKPVRVTFKCEMHLSYQMLRERYLIIEVWQYRSFLLNLFLGMIRVPLIDIVSGSMARFNNIKHATGEKRQFARIYYKIMFQEVWDYKLTFEAWKASNLMGEQGKDMTPALELTLMTESEPSVKSDQHKATKNPLFKNLDGEGKYIHYRGTMESLTEQMLLITIYSNVFSTFCKKLVSLRGIQDSNYLKSQFRLKLKKPPNYKSLIQRQKLHKKTDMKDDDYDSDGMENEDDLLQDKSVYCVVEGRINLNKTPRYMQVGELNRYIPGEYYLVIIINRLEKVLSPDDRGVINTFLTVSWRDQQKVTQIMKDNSNPTYNEELYFKMPILEPEFDILNQKTKAQLINEAISEELRNRPDINIQLWLDGAEIMTDESLGHCRVFVSEIAKAQKQPKVIVTEDNRRRTFETRLQTFKKKFTSGLFNLSPITVHFQACFIPDLPDEIDLSDLNQVPPDFFPIEIAEQMELNDDWRKTNPTYRQWQSRIQNNFKAYGGIQKNAFALFFNSIFVKDQFDNLHLSCKYLEKFYVRYQSQEGTRELFSIPSDIMVKTLHELVHFVRNIPFIGDSFSKREVWMSPDFMLRIRKGFPHDHAVLAACLFLGCELEDQEAEAKKTPDYVPLEHRTFVCLGTQRLSSNQHAWVMTYTYDFTSLIFWDIQDNKRYELKGRVNQKQKKKLRKYIYPEFKPTRQQKSFGFGAFDTKKKMSKKELKKIERRKKKSEQEQAANKKRLDDEKEEKKRKDKEDASRLKEREFSKFQSDNMEVLDSDMIALNTIGLSHTKIKNQRQQGNDPLEISRKEKVMKTTPSQKVEQKQKFQNPFTQQNSQKTGALEKRQEEQEQKRAGQSDAIFSKREIFEGSQDENLELPYATVEIIFNQKNLWGNLANQNPAEIYYHLHDKQYWLPFISYERIVKEGEDDDDDDDDDDEDVDEEDDSLDTSSLVVQSSWMQKVGSFYGAQILTEPIRKDKIKRLIEDVYFEVKSGIVKARAKSGFQTKWKHEADALNKKMLELLQILEYKDTNRTLKIIKKSYSPDPDNPQNQLLEEEEVESRDYDFILSQWQSEVKRLIPKGCKFEGLPMRFTFTQSEKMRTIIVENMSSFFMVENKKIIFNLIGRIYNYPNKVCCVRLLLGYTYSLSEEVEKQLDDESGSDDDVKQSQQPVLQKIDEEEEDPQKPLLGK